jgi:hypothetical protein
MQEPPDDPISEARDAIWHLFEAGLIDEDHATEALLALSLGMQRMRTGHAERSDGAPAA